MTTKNITSANKFVTIALTDNGLRSMRNGVKAVSESANAFSQAVDAGPSPRR
jgi:hypothetical protein